MWHPFADEAPLRRIQRLWRRLAPVRAAFVVLPLLLACTTETRLGPEAIAGKIPDGTVDMHQVQVAYIGSGSAGSGVLRFRGVDYPFRVGGLGVGGIGASTVDAEGEVYNLPSVAQFPGAYAQGRYGFAIGTRSGGDLWLQNERGVIMHLHAKRTGLMLSLGGDAVDIRMDQ